MNSHGSNSSLAFKLEQPERFDPQTMVMDYLPLVKKVASRISTYLPPWIELEDLIGFGVLGLMDAISKYDPEKGVCFHIYAEFRVKGAILDELRNLDWVPRSIRQKNTEINATQDKLEGKLGRKPTQRELARELQLSFEALQTLLSVTKPVRIMSFEDLGISDTSDQVNFVQCLTDKKALDPLKMMLLNSMKKVLAEAIDSLTDKQRMVITLYYYEEMNFKEIGEILAVTESRVCQIHSEASTILRNKVKALQYRS